MRPEKIRGNVFVAKLPHGLTDEQLAEAFDPYGLVLTAHLARDPASGEPRGHGLVQIAPDHAVEKAIAGLDATGIGGRRIEARRADPAMAIVVPAKFLSGRGRA
jgi:RNA recognition motif-containing protein